MSKKSRNPDEWKWFSWNDSPKDAYKSPEPYSVADATGGGGYPQQPETKGIKIRGTGAATKGVTARGPMGGPQADGEQDGGSSGRPFTGYPVKVKNG